MQNQNPQFINSYFSNLLYEHSFSELWWNYEAAELQAFKMFRDSELFAPSIATMTADGSFNTPIKNVQLNQGIIATAVQNGTGLTLTFTNASLNTFRPKDKVFDSKGFQGYVQTSAPGTAVIVPLLNPTSLVAGTHFIAGTIIRDVGNVSATFNSVGTTSLYHDKDVQQDWTEITRNSIQIANAEKVNKFMSTTPEGEDVFFGYTDNEADTFNDWVWQCVYKYMFGQGGTNVLLNDGTGSLTMGITNRIITSSGNYVNTGAPITQTDFETMLMQSLTVDPNYGQNLYVFPGIRAAQRLGQFYPAQTAFAAATKVGNNIDLSLQMGKVNIAGATVNVVYNFGLLNSAKIQDYHKDSVYIFNMGDTIMQGQKGKLLQLIHSNSDPNSVNGSIRKIITGMTGSQLGNATGGNFIGQNEQTSNSVDGYTVEFYDRSGVAAVGKGQGLFQYIH